MRTFVSKAPPALRAAFCPRAPRAAAAGVSTVSVRLGGGPPVSRSAGLIDDEPPPARPPLESVVSPPPGAIWFVVDSMDVLLAGPPRPNISLRMAATLRASPYLTR